MTDLVAEVTIKNKKAYNKEKYVNCTKEESIKDDELALFEMFSKLLSNAIIPPKGEKIYYNVNEDCFFIDTIDFNSDEDDSLDVVHVSFIVKKYTGEK